MADWEDDLLALAEDPVAPQPEKKKRKKKKQEVVEQQKRESSASDMDLSGGSDVETKPMQSKAPDSGDDSDDAAEQGEVRPDLFPYEGIYKNSEDKARLAQMTEIERESILEERREKLQHYEDRQRLKQMVAEQDGMGGFSDSETKPSAAAGTRRKTGAGADKVNKLDELKRKRQSKRDREEKRARRAKDGGSSGDDGSEDSDAYDPSGSRKKSKKKKGNRSASPVAWTDDDDDADEQDSGRAGRASQAKSSAVARKAADAVQSVADLKPIILPRGKLALLWPTPFFEEYVKGAFVRIGVGTEAGLPVYRLAQIDRVSPQRSSKLYDLDKHKTDLKLSLIIGNSQRDFTMQMVSNTEVSDREFDRFVILTREAKADLPTKAFVQQKQEYIARWKPYALTEADINVILEKKKSATRQRGGMELHERHTLTNERDIAKRAGDVQKVAEINEKLAQMEGAITPSVPLPPALAATSSMTASPKAAFSLDERRKNLAAGIGLSTPKGTSRPGSGASTPQRVAQQALSQAATTNGTPFSTTRPPNTSQQGLSHQSTFSKLLSSKIDVDLGDF